MKRIFVRLFAVLALVLLAACAKLQDIKITSCGIESLSPRGFRSMDAVLAVGVDNPTFGFTIQGLDGVVKYRGEEFATYFADTVTIDRKCVRVYDVPCSATLNDNVSLTRVLSLMRKGSLEGFTTDITARVKLRSGVGKVLEFKDLDLRKMME